jgi:hypothetical protein
VSGKWTYRSFNNDPDPKADVGWFIAEMRLQQGGDGEVAGMLNADDPRYAYRLHGAIDKSGRIEMTASGTTSETNGHEYRYIGHFQESWSGAVNQIPCFSGSVLRAKRPDNPALEGKVGSFTSVRRE